MTTQDKPATIIDQLRSRTSYLSTREVMHILRVTRQTLCAWVCSRKLPTYRIGPKNKFDPAIIADWLQARCTA